MDYDDESAYHIGDSVKHPLLRKTLLARAKVNATKGVKPGMTFGRPGNPKEHGVKGSLQWQEYPGTAPNQYQRNFRMLNKESAKIGVTTARGTYEFRKDNDYRLTPKVKQFISHNPGVYDREFTYGIISDPNKDMNKVMQHDYGKEWFEKRVAVDERQRERAQSAAAISQRPTVAKTIQYKKRGGLGTATFRAIQESGPALEEKDHKQAAASFRMRQFFDAPKRVDDRWDREPNRLPREYTRWDYPDYYTQREIQRKQGVPDSRYGDQYGGQQYNDGQ